MEFLKKRGSDMRKKQSKSSYLLPSLMIFLGAAAALLLIGNDAFSAVYAITDGYILAITCVFILLLIPVSGLNLAGSVIVCCLDFLLGIIAALLTANRLCGAEFFSGIWFFWAICIFALVFCALFISSSSRSFSSVILARLNTDIKFRSKLIGFAGLCLVVILIITSAFILMYRLKPEFFI